MKSRGKIALIAAALLASLATGCAEDVSRRSEIYPAHTVNGFVVADPWADPYFFYGPTYYAYPYPYPYPRDRVVVVHERPIVRVPRLERRAPLLRHR